MDRGNSILAARSFSIRSKVMDTFTFSSSVLIFNLFDLHRPGLSAQRSAETAGAVGHVRDASASSVDRHPNAKKKPPKRVKVTYKTN